MRTFAINVLSIGLLLGFILGWLAFGWGDLIPLTRVLLLAALVGGSVTVIHSIWTYPSRQIPIRSRDGHK